MKFEVAKTKEKQNFTPFQITLTFENEKEYLQFYNNLPEDMRIFKNAVFDVCRGYKDIVSGDI